MIWTSPLSLLLLAVPVLILILTVAWFRWKSRVLAEAGDPAVVSRLNAALNEVLADEKFKTRALAMGVEVESRTTPAATKALVQSEIEKWRPIIKASGATN